MSGNGYESVKEKSAAIVVSLREIATLIGPPQKEEIDLSSGERLVPGLGLSEEANNLLIRAKDIEQGIFKVLILGEFKHGKSTLLNAILGSKILPAKALKCTAIITVLVHGESKEVAVYETDKEEPRIFDWPSFVTEFQLTAEDEETMENEGFVYRFKDIAYAQAESTHNLCANGVRLVDSPGLGDHPSRTQITTRFLKQAQAVVLLLNATRLLSEEERNFIKATFKPGRLNHIFFVVNRINQINEKDIPAVETLLQRFLQPYFVDANGEFDQLLYKQRVFFVDAKGALEGRLRNEEDLSKTGVPALEKELELFLTGEAKITAALEAVVFPLNFAITYARREIAKQKELQDLTLTQIKAGAERVEEKLRELEKKKEQIKQTILRFSGAMEKKVCRSLRQYTAEMKTTWTDDARRFDLDEVSLAKVASLFVKGLSDKEAARQKLEAPLKREVRKYLHDKMDKWAIEVVPTVLKNNLDNLAQILEDEVAAFAIELDQVQEMLTLEKMTLPIDLDHNVRSRFFQMFVSSLMLDFGGAGEAIIGKGEWSKFVGRIIQQIIVVAIASLLTGWSFATIYAVVETIQFFYGHGSFKERLLNELGGRLHAQLETELNTHENEIATRIEKQFSTFALTLTRSLQNQIEEKRQELERLITQKQDTSFSSTQEKARLNQIEEKLVALANEVNATIYSAPPEVRAVV